MDAFTLLSELIKALAWPIVVVVIVLMLRRPLSDAIPLLRRVNALGVEVEFSNQLAVVQEKLTDSISPHIDINIAQNQSETQIEVDAAAIEIIIGAWLELRQVVTASAQSFGFEDTSGEITESIKILEKDGRITSDIAKIIQDLEDMKNKAISAHGAKISAVEAKTYAVQAQMLVQFLQKPTEPN